MRIVQKILCGIGGLLAILLLLVLICYLNPNASKALGNMVQAVIPSQTEQSAENPVLGSDNSNTVQPLTQSDPGTSQIAEGLEGILPDTTTNQTYEVPADDSLSIESIVANLNGLVPITSSGEAITQPQVEEIKNTLSVGETGDGLDFDATMYPYYAMLDDDGKTLYRQLYANMDAVTKAYRPVIDTDAALLKNVFSAVCNDQPQLFWIDTAYQYKYGADGKIAEIDLAYNNLINDLDQAKSDFAQAAAPILQGAKGLNSDFDKEVYVHDALMDKISYVLNAPMNQTAYSAMVNEKTVCAGYARAFQFLCMSLDIPTYYCTGYAGENHAWDIIQLDGDFYNVDVTWDDTDPNTHDYFNCTDTEYAKDHARKELSIYLPPCNGEKYGDLVIDLPKEETQTETESPVETESVEESQTEETTVEETSSDTTTEEDIVPEEESTEDYSDVDLAKTVETMEDYYTLCKANLAANPDKDTFTFDILVKNRTLWEDIYLAYRNNAYQEQYVNKALADREQTTCTVDIEATRQSGGSYKLKHTIKFS